MQATTIPGFLFGTRSKVVKISNQVVRDAVRSESWKPVKVSPVIDIATVSADIVLAEPAPLEYDEAIFLFQILPELCSTCRSDDRAEWFRRQFRLTLSGLDHFWFSLAFLANSAPFIQAAVTDDERRECCRQLGRKLLVMWDRIAPLQDRFVSALSNFRGWQYWTQNPLKLLFELDVDADTLIDIFHEQSSDRLRDALARACD